MYKIALIGRPNVGKSTLFNRLVGRRHSITESASGTTRDRVSSVVRKKGRAFELIDTGGLAKGSSDHISKLVTGQIERAIEEVRLVDPANPSAARLLVADEFPVREWLEPLYVSLALAVG